MICSECKKNPAILFYEKIENNKNKMEGLCYDCAKKRGINATDVLAKQQETLAKDKINLTDMNKQLESLFKDFAENLDMNQIGNIEGAITFGNLDDDENDDYDEEKPKVAGAAIPLGSIFSNMFSQNKQIKNETQDSNKKTVKVEMKKENKNKKKKYLDTYGTNLTNKYSIRYDYWKR